MLSIHTSCLDDFLSSPKKISRAIQGQSFPSYHSIQSIKLTCIIIVYDSHMLS
jgi:hypothetical protein